MGYHAPVTKARFKMKNHLKEIVEANILKTLTVYLSNGKIFELDTLANKLKMNGDCLEFVYDSELYIVNSSHIVCYSTVI